MKTIATILNGLDLVQLFVFIIMAGFNVVLLYRSEMMRKIIEEAKPLIMIADYAHDFLEEKGLWKEFNEFVKERLKKDLKEGGCFHGW